MTVATIRSSRRHPLRRRLPPHRLPGPPGRLGGRREIRRVARSVVHPVHRSVNLLEALSGVPPRVRHAIRWTTQPLSAHPHQIPIPLPQPARPIRSSRSMLTIALQVVNLPLNLPSRLQRTRPKPPIPARAARLARRSRNRTMRKNPNARLVRSKDVRSAIYPGVNTAAPNWRAS